MKPATQLTSFWVFATLIGWLACLAASAAWGKEVAGVFRAAGLSVLILAAGAYAALAEICDELRKLSGKGR